MPQPCRPVPHMQPTRMGGIGFLPCHQKGGGAPTSAAKQPQPVPFLSHAHHLSHQSEHAGSGREQPLPLGFQAYEHTHQASAMPALQPCHPAGWGGAARSTAAAPAQGCLPGSLHTAPSTKWPCPAHRTLALGACAWLSATRCPAYLSMAQPGTSAYGPACLHGVQRHTSRHTCTLSRAA